MIHNEQTSRGRLRLSLIFTAALAITAAIAGCGGSSSTSIAYLRPINMVPNGGTATLTGNGTVPQTAAALTANNYASVGSTTDSLAFTLSGLAGTTFGPISQAIGSGTSYSALMIGRADVASSDPRYPKMLVETDSGVTPNNGDASVRVINAAPDAPAIDVSVSGTSLLTDTTYGTVTSYVNQSAEVLTFTILINGSNTVLVTSPQFTVDEGLNYTLVLTETSVSPSPVYAVQLLHDGGP